ncbi:MAG: hypothetical protein IPJ77_13010 [Planctomycetes bacterium]|nr:hypothetical protein [Planctomycetota bacterium]
MERDPPRDEHRAALRGRLGARGFVPSGWAEYEVLPESIRLTAGPITLTTATPGPTLRIGHGPDGDALRIESIAFGDGSTAAFDLHVDPGALFVSTDPLEDLGTWPGAALGSPTFFLIAQDAFLQFTTDTLVLRDVPSIAEFCAGDGIDVSHSTPCPCGNVGSAGRGCANSVQPSGARLVATGDPASDYAVLRGDGMPASVACVYFVGDALADATFGDGVRCVGGTLLRLRTVFNAGGASRFPGTSDSVTLAQRTGVTAGSGARRWYQAYYRSSAPMFCPPATYNVTNGVVIDW